MIFFNVMNARTIHFFLLTLTIQATFTYMNSVFFIYKYKQLYEIMPSKFNVYHLPFLLLPTLTYYVVRFILAKKIDKPIIKFRLVINLLLLTAIYMKMISYILDAYFTICMELVSFLLVIMNVLIAYTDSYLLHILEGLSLENMSSNTTINVLFEEIPNYLFAFIFGILESLVKVSCRPYFDIVAILYISLAIYYLLYEHKIIENKVYGKENTLKLVKHRYIIMLFKILCTILEILIYIFLMSTMKDQNFLVMYFSFEFVFKIVNYTPKEKYMYVFLFFKFFIMFLTLYYVLRMTTTVDYTLTVFLFITNGITNRLVHKCYDELNLQDRETICTDVIVFVFVSFFIIFFAQKEDETFEDFIFFSSVRL